MWELLAKLFSIQKIQMLACDWNRRFAFVSIGRSWRNCLSAFVLMKKKKFSAFWALRDFSSQRRAFNCFFFFVAYVALSQNRFESDSPSSDRLELQTMNEINRIWFFAFSRFQVFRMKLKANWTERVRTGLTVCECDCVRSSAVWGIVLIRLDQF